jgi:hypothetical protein
MTPLTFVVIKNCVWHGAGEVIRKRKRKHNQIARMEAGSSNQSKSKVIFQALVHDRLVVAYYNC